MERGPTILYCLGATKAGTSWLYYYLSEHPQVRMPAIKELHYWDALASGAFDFWIEEAEKERDRHVRLAVNDPDADERARQRAQAEEIQNWIDILSRQERDDTAYRAFLAARTGQARLTGDMTPAYGLLPEDWLGRMARVGDDVRFIYLLRDPVQRLWSHCRMMAQRRAKPGEDFTERAQRVLKRVFKGKEPYIVERSDYRTVLSRITRAVPCDRLHVAFYEDLFTPEAIDRICRFLGLDTHSGKFGQRIMKGPAIDMAPGQYDEARTWLDGQYRFAAEFFDRLPDAWDAERVEV